MFDFIRDNQLNIMLLLCGACAMMWILLHLTRFLPKSRKKILILMEIIAFFLLWFDRQAYIFAGVSGDLAYVMVRLSNALVFFLTPGILFGFNLYLSDWLKNEGGQKTIPKRLKVVAVVSVIGMVMAVISAFTGLYYYFDANNTYHRGGGFLIAYIIPVICPIIQLTVVRQYRKVFGKLIYISMLLYLIVPLFCGILQIFTYGISIVNMSMVAVSVSLYIFTYIDINNTVEHAHDIEIMNMQGEQRRMQRLFSQTAMSFVSAVEKKDDFAKGNAVRVAEYAKRIAKMSGKSDDDCEKVYYAALLHDVGMIGVPDSVIKNESDPTKWDYEAMRKKPIIGKEILANITEYPYLAVGAQYSHERYNGTGYPQGLSGEDIPEIARIIAVADAFVTMTAKKRYREARPVFTAREALVKGAGETYDPVFAGYMVQIIDSDNREKEESDIANIETELTCKEYRSAVTKGIPIDNGIKRIRFDAVRMAGDDAAFCGPSVIVFDSYDRMIHDNDKSIEAYNYVEYGELWFDQHNVTTAARKIENINVVETSINDLENMEDQPDNIRYEITMGRYEDHLQLKMTGPSYAKEVIIALPGGAKGANLSITGEHCEISNIDIELTGAILKEGDIERIAEEISYTDYLESDIRNVQILSNRSAATEGLELENRLKMEFHTRSLPSAELVWNCPYIVIYTSDDGSVKGPGYKEYALIKINGEVEESEEHATNRFIMKKRDVFPGWDEWKSINKKGMDCEVAFERKNDRIITKTENLGISIENTTVVKDNPDKVYVALTGDQVALMDIRIRNRDK